MTTELKETLEKGLNDLNGQLKTAMDDYNSELEKHGKASTELTGRIDDLSGKFKEMRDEIADLAQKQTPADGVIALATAGNEFVKSEMFEKLASGQSERARFAVKNTVVADTTTTFPSQRPGVIAGDFKPLTIRQLIPTINVASNAVNSLREATNTNNAAEVSQAAAKTESAITFEQYNVNIETVAHWIKVSNQLLADAPAVAQYIERHSEGWRSDGYSELKWIEFRTMSSLAFSLERTGQSC